MDEQRLKEFIADYYINANRLADYEKTIKDYGGLKASTLQSKTKSSERSDPTLARVLERDAHSRKMERIRMKVQVVDAFVTYLKRGRQRDLARLVEYKKEHGSIRSFCKLNQIGIDKLRENYNRSLTTFCAKQQTYESAI